MEPKDLIGGVIIGVTPIDTLIVEKEGDKYEVGGAYGYDLCVVPNWRD